MKKILLAFDGRHFSEGAFEFARILNENKRIWLTGVFLPEVDYAMLSDYSSGGIVGNLSIPIVDNITDDYLLKSIERFELLCKKNLIEYSVHYDQIEFALPQLKKETGFSDLLIIGSESFYKNLGSDEPNEYLEDTLHEAQCPVVVVPEKFNFPQTNILAFDGSSSSIYAIKQFAYLFPDLTQNPTILAYETQNLNLQLPDEVNIEELVGRHFRDLTLFKFGAEPRQFFNTWLNKRNNAMLIAGSYGRSGLSRLFHKSFLTNVIKDHHIPVFTTHNK